MKLTVPVSRKIVDGEAYLNAKELALALMEWQDAHEQGIDGHRLARWMLRD